MTTEDRHQTIESSEDNPQNEGHLSPLTLPPTNRPDLAAQVEPVTSVRGVVRNLLSRLPGRTLSPQTTKEDTNLLVETLNRARNTAIYAPLLVGPAAAIWVYQYALRLTGKNPEDAFPDGTWQFYVEYALREDTARHAIETNGFDTTFDFYNIRLSQLDRLTAWVMASIHILHEYDDILENEWRERVYITVLRQLMQGTPDADYYAGLYREWELQRPYNRHDTQPGISYSAYRKSKFDKFLEQALKRIPEDVRRQWVTRIREEEELYLAKYKQQMTIAAYLEPDEYGETRKPSSLAQAHIGVIYQGQYYLIPVTEPGTARPPLVQTVRRQIASILDQDDELPPVQLTGLASLTRSSWPTLKEQLNPELVGSLLLLRTSPILLNFDQRPRHLHLSKLRQAERGVGDHAMTVFDTGETFVFDLSHIFFDGTWGAALAEIMTNEASSWATFLRLQPRLQPGRQLYDDDDHDALPLDIKTADWEIIQHQTRTLIEASGETKAINLGAIIFLRKFFKERSDLLQLTVNDILVLYRAIHAMTYEPAQGLIDILNALSREEGMKEVALATLEAIQPGKRVNPNILIPLDASKLSPRERLHPMTFSVPFEALDLSNLHAYSIKTLADYNRGKGTFVEFDQIRHKYFGALAGFGELFSRSKEIAALGETASVGSIKLLAHLPKPIQRLLDRIPNRFEVLNDIIKGREVFSNIGAVVPGSTLTRFMTAKDDNENKTLVWAVMTDAERTMYITLRDFRPHVGLLIAAGYEELANRITQDYLDAYARGLNGYVGELLQITLANPQ